MIGTKLRGIRHLWRLAEASTLGYVLAKNRDRDYDVCEFIKTPVDFPKGEKMIIFNHYINHNSDIYREITSDPSLSSQVNGIEHCRVLGIYKNHKTDTLQGYNQFFSELILLPYSFKKDYESFLKENSKMVKTLENKYSITLYSNSLAKAMYVFTNGSKNFFQWAINLYYNQGVSAETIKLILQWNDNYGQLTKNLSKGTITAYTTRDSLVTLLDELGDLRNKKRINDSINSFNTMQKKLFKSRELTSKENKALSRFAKLSDTKRLNFIKKVSSIDDIDELMRQLKHVTSTHFDWTKESFMEYITNVDGINHEIIVDNGNIVLTKVNDYETIKQFGKTTNWCISKNKTYWNNYIEHFGGKTAQYMLFNFSKMEDDKLSIVGLTTTHNKGITSAHNFVNDNLMNATKKAELLKSFISKFKNNNDIYSVLSDCGIDISSIVHFDKPSYKWDIDSLIEYLFECVSPENVDIIKDGLSDENKIVISVRDENIRYFLGDAYIDNVSSEYWGNQHILFIDFAKSQYDPNKLQFSIIFDGDLGDDYPNALYNELGNPVNNEDFDSKVFEFGLPYDIIRRSSNKYSMLVKAFVNHNINLLNKYVSNDKKMLKGVLGEIDEESIYSIMYDSVLSFYSFDYLNLIYDNGYILSDFMDEGSITDFLGKILRRFIEYAVAINNDATLMSPSKELIDKFHEDKLSTMEEALYVGTYLQLKMVLDHEQKKGMKYNSIYYGLMSNFNRGSKGAGTFTDELMLFVVERINFKSDGETLRLCITNGMKYGGDEVKERIAERSKESKIATELYECVLKALNTPKKKVNINGVYSTVTSVSI